MTQYTELTLNLSKYTFYLTKNNQGDFTVNLIKHILLAQHIKIKKESKESRKAEKNGKKEEAQEREKGKIQARKKKSNKYH